MVVKLNTPSISDVPALAGSPTSDCLHLSCDDGAALGLHGDSALAAAAAAACELKGGPAADEAAFAPARRIVCECYSD